MKALFLIIIATLSLNASAASKKLPTPTPTVTPAPTPIASPSLSWESSKASERKGWSTYLVGKAKDYSDGFGKLPDARRLCPKYDTLAKDRQDVVWAELISSMAYYESSWKPETLFRECNVKKCVYSGGCFSHPTYGFCMKGGHKLDGGIVISRGLTQISYGSALAYKCEVAKPADLHDPKKNLDCTLKILKQMSAKRGNIFVGVGNYWAVIKQNNPSNRISEIINKVRKQLPFCE